MFKIVKFKNITELNQFKRPQIKTVINSYIGEFKTYTDATSHIEFNLKAQYLPRCEFSKVYFTIKGYDAVWYDGINFYSIEEV
ncbi:MAG: hypothetical protein ACRCXT_23880 [Paraclostridium sp.]